MIEMVAMAPAAIGFAVGVPCGSILLGIARWAGRSSTRRRMGGSGQAPLPPLAPPPAAAALVSVRGTVPVMAARRAPPPRTVEEHALALARWVLEPRPGGLRGRTVTAVEMIEIYAELCGELGVDPRGWQPVAIELQRLLGISKRYGTIGGKRARVYHVPDRNLDELLAEAGALRKSEQRRRPTPSTAGEAAAMAA